MRAILKKLTSLAAPEALVLVGSAVFVSLLADRAPVATLLGFYPHLVFASGALLCGRFHRGRVLYALAVLLLADRALIHLGGPWPAAPAAGADPVLQLVALLVPLNLVVLAVLPERRLFSTGSALRVLGLLAQVALVGWFSRGGAIAARSVAVIQRIPGSLDWSPLSPVALGAFGLAAAALVVRLIRAPTAIQRGFLWALVAAFVALHSDPAPQGSTFYFSTAGLIFVVAVIEASYAMAYRDGLTGLPTRRALNEALSRLGGQYSIAMVDVDHFKKFNDKHGHDIGDQVLRMVASELEKVSGGGRPFRYGGEEFALLFPGKTVEESQEHLEELREAVENAGFTVRGQRSGKDGRGNNSRKKKKNKKKKKKKEKTLSVTVSIGAAERDEKHASPDEVVKAADDALYKAKKAGRNTTVLR